MVLESQLLVTEGPIWDQRHSVSRYRGTRAIASVLTTTLRQGSGCDGEEVGADAVDSTCA